MVSSRRSRLLIVAAIVATIFFFIFSTASRSPPQSAGPGPSPHKPADKVSPEIAGAFKAAQDNVRLQPDTELKVADAGVATEQVEKVAPVAEKVPETAPAVKETPQENQESEPAADQAPAYDAAAEYAKTIRDAPLVIFSKSYCPHSKFAKQLLLHEYSITPEPIVVELDLHPNGSELQQHIGDVTGRRTVPNIHVFGTSRGGADDFRTLKAEGIVVEKLLEWAKHGLYEHKGPGPAFTIKQNQQSQE
ncbi:uncharacterized protein SAPINGB_P002731 [Magnusiomyces paraingens]|uniref:Glutaredoxin domain-containing protein n=1 Tax=Magnusiomyces paraingens TaxID=2606893 RepID=A0A5E8BFG5_9ASCO|nr:uncharacterized protein SAPINGB_P002731 [Saprochaete ingens]VVT50374.1 unnamed protein product [Saprochaete ingens]